MAITPTISDDFGIFDGRKNVRLGNNRTPHLVQAILSGELTLGVNCATSPCDDNFFKTQFMFLILTKFNYKCLINTTNKLLVLNY